MKEFMKFGMRLLRAAVIAALALSIGSPHPATAQKADTKAIMNRYIEFHRAGNFSAALVEARRFEAAMKAQFGTNHWAYGSALGIVALAYQNQGNLREAEAFSKRAVTIYEKTKGRDDPFTAGGLNDLANIYRQQGRFAEAEPLYQRALTIDEKAKGSSHPDVATKLYNLAVLYNSQDRYEQAEGFYKRALAIFEKSTSVDQSRPAQMLNALGFYQTYAGQVLNGLASLYTNQAKYAEAEPLYQRAVAILEKNKETALLANTLHNLGRLYQQQDRDVEAEGFYKRALAIHEKARSENHPFVPDTLTNLGNLKTVQGRPGEAEGFLKRAVAISEKTLGPKHPQTAESLSSMAALEQTRGDVESALALSRKATAAVLAHASSEALGSREKETAGSLVGQRGVYFRRHVASLAAAAVKGNEPIEKVGNEAVEIAQWAIQSTAGSAIQQMALRFSSGTDALAGLVREIQDLSAFRRQQDKALIEALSKPDGQRNAALIEATRRQIAEIERKLAIATGRIEKEFPEYAALAAPKPLKVEEAQKLLAVDEALVFWLTGDPTKDSKLDLEARENKESYVFAITRDGFAWKTIPIGAKDLAAKVAAFRRGLDVNEFEEGSKAGKPVLFDLALAHKLYKTLLGPVEGLIKDKKHLMAVPAGPMTALPLHLLVTGQTAEIKDIADYRETAWLLKRHAVTVLPSVASLKALRVFAQKTQGAKPLVGFGDPVFKADVPQQTADLKTGAKTRSYAEYWQGASVDRTKLADALPRLADTAVELKAVAQKLGAPLTDIYLREAATEAKVKGLPLVDYRVVYFATHGLVAGDIKGLAEPSLALTLPKQPSESDDGLLTASEVARLKLNADWVVLSACNTAAGDKPGAEALSGLARAFFYAGARALLVSHWAVESNAATQLTTSTFEQLKSDPKLGRAEALRRAMLLYMNEASNPRNAYPAYWAPFLIIGEGAAQ